MGIGIPMEILFSFNEWCELFHRDKDNESLKVNAVHHIGLVTGFNVHCPTILSAASMLLGRHLNSASAQDERRVHEKLQLIA
jgi:hypothetical protein